MTRKQAHTLGISQLVQAKEAAALAHSLLEDARTAGAVETGRGQGLVTAQSVVGTLEQLAEAARAATCEDCDVLIAECPCPWSNEPAGGAA